MPYQGLSSAIIRAWTRDIPLSRFVVCRAVESSTRDPSERLCVCVFQTRDNAAIIGGLLKRNKAAIRSGVFITEENRFVIIEGSTFQAPVRSLYLVHYLEPVQPYRCMYPGNAIQRLRRRISIKGPSILCFPRRDKSNTRFCSLFPVLKILMPPY